jgi:uncharacterized membrane protein YhhN
MAAQGILAVVYTIEIAALLWGAHPRNKDQYYVGIKMLCSVSFWGIALLFTVISKHWDYGWLMLLPMAFCVVGDLFMGLYQVKRKRRNLVLGLVFFLLAHFGLLLVLFHLDTVFNLWNVLVPAVALLAFVFLKLKLHLHLGRMMIPACIYTLLLTLMLSKSLQYFYLHPSIASAWIGLGGLLFFLSDFTIIFLYFYRFRSRENKLIIHYVNLVTYYFAMLAFDMSILYLAVI